MGKETVGNFVKRQFSEHWGSSLSEEGLAEWILDLSGFNLYQITQAFAEHRKFSSYRPKAKDILGILIDKLPKSNDIQNNVKEKCYVISCKNNDIDPCAYNPKVFMCRFHHDEYILKVHPGTIQAEVIRRARKFQEEAKEFGMTGKEYFDYWMKNIFQKPVSSKQNITAKHISDF
jgi:hypothetical protein